MPKYDSCDIQYAERMQQRYQREHNLLNTRTSIFSVLQALLISGSGLTIRFGGAPPSAAVMFAMWAMGFGGSLIWLLLATRTRAVQTHYSTLLIEAEKQAYEERHRIHEKSVKYRNDWLGGAPPLHASMILGVFFPAISVTVWVVLGITFFSNWWNA